MKALLPTVDDWLTATGKVALATVTSTWGSAPRPIGAHMVVHPDGSMAGSVSGGCVEGAVVEAALSVLDSGTPQLLAFGVADELAWEVGLACGGRITVWVDVLRRDAEYEAWREAVHSGKAVAVSTALDGSRAGARLVLGADGQSVGDLGPLQATACIAGAEALTHGRAARVEALQGALFVQPYLPAPRLIVIGAVHTAIPLVSLAQTLGYLVTVVDARAAFATRERFPEADQLLVEWPDTALARLRPDANTAVVVLSHEAKFDEPALLAALESDAGYVGAIGSHATSETRLVRLRTLGCTTSQLERIHGPIGLDIGAETPAETALSILAEIVATQHDRAGGRLRLSIPEHAV